MRSVKLIPFVLAACLVVAACVPASVPTAPAVSPVPTADVPTPGTQETPVGPVTVTYWEEDSDDAGLLLDKLAAAFMKANPEIQIVREHYGYDELRNLFRARAFLAGADQQQKLPELVRAPGEFAGPFGELEIVQPVEEIFSADFLGQYLTGALEGATAQGRLWGVPDNFGNHVMLLYNIAIVSEVPPNTDAWIIQLKTLTDAGSPRWGLAYPVEESYWLIPWLAGLGGWPLDDNDMPALDTAEMIEALWFVHDLRFMHRVVPMEANYESTFDLFRQGQAAYVIDGAWNLQRYKELGIDVGITSLPRVSKTSLLPVPMATGRYWMIAKGVGAAKLDAAARFVEFMTSRDAQLEWIAQGSGLGEIQRLPSHREAASSELLTGDPVLAGVLAQLRVAKGVPPALEMACAWQGMGAYLPAVMAGQMSPDDAAPAMQAEADACLGDMGGPATPAPGEPQVSPEK